MPKNAPEPLPEEEKPLLVESVVEKELPETFDESKLTGVLEAVVKDFRQLHKSMEIAVIKQPFVIQQEQIVFYLSGELQKDIFLKLKPELTGILRKSLRHSRVELGFEIKEEAEDATKKLYTSTDKLLYLREKSPALKELQQRFGLETDF